MNPFIYFERGVIQRLFTIPVIDYGTLPFFLNWLNLLKKQKYKPNSTSEELFPETPFDTPDIKQVKSVSLFTHGIRDDYYLAVIQLHSNQDKLPMVMYFGMKD